jgi:hypothetical protein
MSALQKLAVILLVALLPTKTTSQRAHHCVRISQVQETVRLIGEFTAESPEKLYCVFARRGQRMRVTVVPQTPDLNTQGNVRYPRTDLQPGGPGGVILNEQLPDDGIYRNRIAQRFGEKKPGRFELIIELGER